ncbi:MAG: YifB family Mg chelatase-like AAA ATPase [Candidatus Merdisoma sp.]
MFSKVLSAGIGGVDAYPVRVEADVSEGLPQFLMVGYLASEVKEAGDRVRTALRNAGCPLPARRITVNLAPASVRKAGSRFDLAVAAAVLASMQKIPAESLGGLMIAGELSLSGQVLGIPGVLALAEAARAAGVKRCIVPSVNAREGALIQEVEVVGVSDLTELIELLRHPEKGVRTAVSPDSLLGRSEGNEAEDFSQIHGQKMVRRAAEVAAAGMHNFLMIGPPGSGKTMIARRIPGILPPLKLEESLKITKIYSVAGLLPPGEALITKRPFRAPHHTTTAEALAGGGRLPIPGEISLSSGGILFLDELPEFRRSALEILRQPLEEHRVCISRTAGTYVFPADFMLVAAMNPCACGYYPDRSRCTCAPRETARYLGRLSQPLLDRIDICMQAPRLSYGELQGEGENESSASIRRRVEEAHRIQKERFQGAPARFNSRMSVRDTERFCCLGQREKQLLKEAFDRFSLSARAYHRLLRVARTIADLEQEERVREGHILEALGYRPYERSEWLKEV